MRVGTQCHNAHTAVCLSEPLTPDFLTLGLKLVLMIFILLLGFIHSLFLCLVVPPVWEAETGGKGTIKSYVKMQHGPS